MLIPNSLKCFTHSIPEERSAAEGADSRSVGDFASGLLIK